MLRRRWTRGGHACQLLFARTIKWKGGWKLIRTKSKLEKEGKTKQKKSESR